VAHIWGFQRYNYKYFYILERPGSHTKIIMYDTLPRCHCSSLKPCHSLDDKLKNMCSHVGGRVHWLRMRGASARTGKACIMALGGIYMDSGHASRTVSAVVTNHDCSWSIHLRGTSSTRTTSEHHDGGLLPWVKCSQRAGCPLGIDVTWNFSAGGHLHR
jgi:hypothetical protein